MLYRDDIEHGQFEWIHFDDSEQSVLIWRRGHGDDELMMIANFTPVPRDDYEFRVASASDWSVLANSDDLEYGGSGYLVQRSVTSHELAGHHDAYALRMSLPPLSIVVLGRLG